MGARLYEGMNIQGRAGLTNAQKATLLRALGALVQPAGGFRDRLNSALN